MLIKKISELPASGTVTDADGVLVTQGGASTLLTMPALKEYLRTQGLGASSYAVQFTATIPTTGWTGSAAPYKQTIQVLGMLATDKPTVDLVASDNYEKAELEIEEYGKIYKITTAKDSITVYASEPTTTAMNIQMEVLRNG